MRPVVFIPEFIHASGRQALSIECDLVTPWKEGTSIMDVPQSDTEHRAPLYEADAVIVRTFTISSEDMQRSQRLRAIVNHGVGVDNIDLKAAAEHGIPVAYTPTGNTNAVAEHVVALMMALSRRVVPARQALIEGQFNRRNEFQGAEVAGKTLGIIGMGRIGRQIVKKALGLDMKVIAYDAFVSASDFPAHVLRKENISHLLSGSDYITLHVPLTDQTHHMINRETIGLMKSDARVINTSRGPVIDQEALHGALLDGRLGGAALDVFEEEPLSAHHPLNDLPNTILTPHIAGLTETAMERISMQSAQAVLNLLHGRPAEFPITDEMGF
ncbi:MAG: hydroxyacid dehydrogenase [Candidatus Latescibacteria bacterium]|nr:hydroxyacid dehydrogenase [Candidatus Latescibacterota bacterium]